MKHLLIGLIALIVTACGNPKDPAQTLRTYMDAIMNGQFQVAYAMLHPNTRQGITQAQFVRIMANMQRLRQLSMYDGSAAEPYTIAKTEIDGDTAHIVIEEMVPALTGGNLYNFAANAVTDDEEAKLKMEMEKVQTPYSLKLDDDGEWKIQLDPDQFR